MAYDTKDLIDMLIVGPSVALHLCDGEAPIAETRLRTDAASDPRPVKTQTLLFKIEGPVLESGETREIIIELLSGQESAEALQTQFSAFQVFRSRFEFDLLVFRHADSLRAEIRRPGFTHGMT
jgi:hypothetical protein